MTELCERLTAMQAELLEGLARDGLDPVYAITIAGRLIDAAARHLRSGEPLAGISGSDAPQGGSGRFARQRAPTRPTAMTPPPPQPIALGRRGKSSTISVRRRKNERGGECICH